MNIQGRKKNFARSFGVISCLTTPKPKPVPNVPDLILKLVPIVPAVQNVPIVQPLRSVKLFKTIRTRRENCHVSRILETGNETIDGPEVPIRRLKSTFAL